MIPAGKRGERGQVSIFLAITLLIVITFLAFVINVGLFVKAKINLQNAVDAAAWSGAAVQARQLTNIAWLNWEMRNTYKEWMFKYYVLGNLTNPNLKPPGIDDSPRTNFRLHPFDYSTERDYNKDAFDRFNVPSICIHHGTAHNICYTVNIPGIPRFKALGLPSITDHHESLINALVSSKGKDCSARTEINFQTAMLWAFGTGNPELFPSMPQIAAHRRGAWTESIELALRMRNLEMMVNVPPLNSLCADDSSGEGCRPIGEVESKADIPLYERPIKAFWSAFRNLGGGPRKNQDPFSKSFTLTELAPTPFTANPSSLSGFLIPEGNGKFNGLEKHYLDLQAFSLNLATFYTTFASFTEKRLKSYTGDNQGLDAEAGCAASKTALPVPGYILGFAKNPAVLTYYAVKGEARYTGLFFPFSETNGIKMSAYAAAKPFGGRIGPRLFSIDLDGSTVRPRDEPNLSRSGPYISGFDIVGTLWKPFQPIPFDSTFWITNSARPLGGTPKAGGDIYFGIPNLVYDYERTVDEIKEMDNGNIDIEILRPAANRAASEVTDETMGLYNSEQYTAFRDNLQENGSFAVLTPENIEESLDRARRPTRYEALNYLIPTLGNADDNLESPHVIASDPSNPTRGNLELFAPLFGKDTLYENGIETIINVISSYLDYSRPATAKYLAALQSMSDSIKAQRTTGTGSYQDAADLIHSGTLELPPDPCPDLSMAQTYNQYFNGTATQCKITPLKEEMRAYFNKRLGAPDGGEHYQNFYTAPYIKPDDPGNTELMSAYFPGPRQGAGARGRLKNPFRPIDTIAKRNFYSTKFFAIEKVEPSGKHSYDRRAPLYLEKGSTSERPTDPTIQINAIRNTLPSSRLAKFGTERPH